MRSTYWVRSLLAAVVLTGGCGERWTPAQPEDSGFVIAVPGELACDRERQESSLGRLTGRVCSATSENWYRKWFGDETSELTSEVRFLVSWFDLPAIQAKDVPHFQSDVMRRNVVKLRRLFRSDLAQSEELPIGEAPDEVRAISVDGVVGVEYSVSESQGESVPARLAWRERLFVYQRRLYRVSVCGAVSDRPQAPDDPRWERFLDSFHFVRD
jgi:hypothetical protein